MIEGAGEESAMRRWLGQQGVEGTAFGAGLEEQQVWDRRRRE